jgi:hypothetical protein
MTDRLAQLEQQAAAITAEIAALKSGKAAPPPQPPKDEGVRILQVLDERSDLPNLREMERLYAAVRNLSPWPQALVDKFDENRPFRAFSSTFRWLLNKPRADQPNPKLRWVFGWTIAGLGSVHATASPAI